MPIYNRKRGAERKDKQHTPSHSSSARVSPKSRRSPNQRGTSDQANGTPTSNRKSRARSGGKVPSMHSSDEDSHTVQQLKRDSVHSQLAPNAKPYYIRPNRARWILQPQNWWPCRWVLHFTTALVRGFRGRYWKDFLLTFSLLAASLFAGYFALETILGTVKGVYAQEVPEDCSIVYVTVPGPIVTVSLIGASPSIPGQGT
jgi:hypothetical protein